MTPIDHRRSSRLDWFRRKQREYEHARKELLAAEIALAKAALEIHRLYDIDGTGLVREEP